MAECVGSPSFIKWRMRSYGKERGCMPHNSNFTMAQRRHSRGRYKVMRLSMQKPSNTNISGVRNLKAHPRIRETPLRCNCLGFLVDPEGVTASDWVPVGDQILLMTSIFLTYMAGVIPVQKSNFTSQNNVTNNNVFPGSSTFPGRQDDYKDNVTYVWEVVKSKLLDSLDAIEHGNNIGNGVLELEKDEEKHPLSLHAVTEGPKLRLLWASFQQLEKEVNNISSSADTLDMDAWAAVLSQIIQEFSQPVSVVWLEKELALANGKRDQGLISQIIEKLKTDDRVHQNIIKLGKKDLYAELLYFLRFGSLRKGCCHDHSLFTLHADSILEDLVVTLADGIASNYLELISVDGSLSDEISSLGLVLCKLSTRSLQRLRNESQFTDETGRDSHTGSQSWWRKLGLGKSETVTPGLRYIVITQVSIAVKRTKELRALTGWRYYFSLFLELSDISMPLIKAVFKKISDAISFFLVCLIGRSLGLIYTGIRQSLRWK